MGSYDCDRVQSDGQEEATEHNGRSKVSGEERRSSAHSL